MIVLILFNALIANGSYVLIAPFLPLEFESKGVSQEMIGIVFAAFPIGTVLASPIIGEQLENTGRRVWLVGGTMFTGAIFLTFGMMSYMENINLMVGISLFARLIQGAANGAV